MSVTVLANLNRKFSSISANSAAPTSLIKPPSPGRRFRVIDILACNTLSVDTTVSVFIREQDAKDMSSHRADFFLVKDMFIPANTSVEIIDGNYPIYWENIGSSYFDHLMAYAGSAGMDIIIGMNEE
tara:strand:- start:106 stop:486 length:381 start_codon:yes stop_codon:yes gene_type:complete